MSCSRRSCAVVPRVLVVQSRPTVAVHVSTRPRPTPSLEASCSPTVTAVLGAVETWAPARRARRPHAARRSTVGACSPRSAALGGAAAASSCGSPTRPTSIGRSRSAPTPGSTTTSTSSPPRADWCPRSPPDPGTNSSRARVVRSGNQAGGGSMPRVPEEAASEDRRRVAREADARAVPGRPQGRHRAGVHR